MTFREKLAKEHPECINDRYYGGCENCPSYYDYDTIANESKFCSITPITESHCRKCWDREIPGTEVPETEVPENIAEAMIETRQTLVNGGFNSYSAEAVVIALINRGYFDK